MTMRLFAMAVLCTLSFKLMAQEPLTVEISFISKDVERPPVLSNLIEEPEDQGLMGARLALKDNNTTGRFLKQAFKLKETRLGVDEDIVPAIQDLIAQGQNLFVLDLDGETLARLLLETAQKDIVFFNARTPENKFRQAACDARLFHTFPSRAMLTDALSQYMIKKRWSDWFLIAGKTEGDEKFAASLKNSAQKFGAKIIAEKSWDGARDARRTAQAEVPLLTQGEDYDILMVADEWGDFGEFMMYRTFDPRPVAGTQGLFATGWFWTQEQWGAAQLQKRFQKIAKRPMGARDYAAWAAVRTIGEAVTRTNTNDFRQLKTFIQSDGFELAAFKGRKLSYRSWNGQLRQPIALTQARSLVAQAPIEGFLHQRTELDTLGFDQPETTCQEFLK